MWPVWAEFSLFGRPLAFTGYGVFAILGAALGTYLCVRAARRFSFPIFDAFAASVIAVACGLVGAKALYVAVEWDRVQTEGWGVVLGQGGLVWYGGFVGGALAAFVYLRAYRLSLAAFADCATPGMAVGHALGRVGCFMAGCCFGAPTDLPWGVAFPETPFFTGPVGVHLHPVQLYEAGGEFLLAALAWFAAGKVRKGGVLGVWLVGYGVLRLVMELGFRADDRGTGLFGLPPSVVLSGLAVLAGVAVLQAPRSLTRETFVS